MFHENEWHYTALEEKQIMEGINSLMTHLDNSDNYKAKLVVAADYLTTLYQLLHLRQKY